MIVVCKLHATTAVINQQLAAAAAVVNCRLYNLQVLSIIIAAAAAAAGQCL